MLIGILVLIPAAVIAGTLRLKDSLDIRLRFQKVFADLMQVVRGQGKFEQDGIVLHGPDAVVLDPGLERPGQRFGERYEGDHAHLVRSRRWLVVVPDRAYDG